MHTSKIQAAPVTTYFLLVFTVPNYTFKFQNSVVDKLYLILSVQ